MPANGTVRSVDLECVDISYIAISRVFFDNSRQTVFKAKIMLIYLLNHLLTAYDMYSCV